MNNKILKAIIRKRSQILFNGSCFAVSSKNKVGPFDILRNHANFVAEISEKIIIHVSKKDKKEFLIDSGIISARNNLVEVFIL